MDTGGVTVEIFIPWRDEPGRRQPAAIVDAWLHEEFPTWFKGPALSPLDPFTRASACNLAAARSSADVVVFVDADSIVPSVQLMRAVSIAADQKAVVRAYTVYNRLTEQATAGLESWREVERGEVNWTQVNTPSHGVWAVHRQTFVDAGGYDPRFVYFYDDCSFDIRAGVIPQPRVTGSLFHLWHPPRNVPEADEELWLRYQREDPFLVRAEAGFPL